MSAHNSRFHANFHYEYIPAQIGRPKRDLIINHEDVINLQIALALSKDVLDFIQDHHIF